jgi:SNF2 family DNA or RNA helicase
MQYLQDNSEFAAKRSLKLQRLDSIIDEAIENKESILVFSQYKEICEAINKFFALKYNTYLLHGSISRTARDAMIEEFQDEAGGSKSELSYLMVIEDKLTDILDFSKEDFRSTISIIQSF